MPGLAPTHITVDLTDQVVGVLPLDNTAKATADLPGIVQPDGSTITIDPETGIISSTGGGGGGGFYTAFADDEVVAGLDEAWTLAEAPSPVTCLQLFAQVPDVGWVLLVKDVDYIISGTDVTTSVSYAAETLRAWYRYNGGAIPNYAEDETVAGSLTAWTLAEAPSPTSSLQLYVKVPMFGWVLLVESTDYSIVGDAITTFTSYAMGALKAWYRY